MKPFTEFNAFEFVVSSNGTKLSSGAFVQKNKKKKLHFDQYRQMAI